MENPQRGRPPARLLDRSNGSGNDNGNSNAIRETKGERLEREDPSDTVTNSNSDVSFLR